MSHPNVADQPNYRRAALLAGGVLLALLGGIAVVTQLSPNDEAATAPPEEPATTVPSNTPAPATPVPATPAPASAVPATPAPATAVPATAVPATATPTATVRPQSPDRPPVLMSTSHLQAAAEADYSGWQPQFVFPRGVTERDGLILSDGLPTSDNLGDDINVEVVVNARDAQAVDECLPTASIPIYSHGPEGDTLVGSLPADIAYAINVSWAGFGFAEASCGQTSILWTAQFVNGAFDLSTAQAWMLEDQPRLQVWARWLSATSVRVGSWVLDLDAQQWQWSPSESEERVDYGASDSGRFVYWAPERVWVETIMSAEPAEHNRVMVTDTVTGESREFTDSNLGIDAWRFLFGPGDEVAWMVGDELGTGAYLGRIDWSTGQLIDGQSLHSVLDEYWAHPWSGSGDPGPDVIAFEPDGTLRAWAWTKDPLPDDTRPSRIETITMRLDS